MLFNNIDPSTKDFLSRLCSQSNQKNNTKSYQSNGNGKSENTKAKDKKNCPINLTPTQVLVIAGVLGGVLDVNSVLVDRAQTVEILLRGSLKQLDGTAADSSELENILAQIGDKPFDEVMKAIINRLA